MPSVILVVDDLLENRVLAEAVLRAAVGERFEVRTYADWTEAAASLRGERPAAVVLDVEMPERDGFAVLADIRAAASLRDVPVLGWTATIADRAPADLIARGFDAELPKPLMSEADFGAFTHVVVQWAERGRRESSLDSTVADADRLST